MTRCLLACAIAFVATSALAATTPACAAGWTLTRNGRFVRAFGIPANLRPLQADEQPNYTDGRPTVVHGRRKNSRGVAIGPRLEDGSRAALIGSDNDYSVTQTGEGEQFDVCIGADTGERAEVAMDTPCPAGSALIPAYLLSFKVR